MSGAFLLLSLIKNRAKENPTPFGMGFVILLLFRLFSEFRVFIFEFVDTTSGIN